MSPLNGPDKKILFKKQLFDLEVKGQGLTKVITVRDTPLYGHAPTYQNIIDLSGKTKKLWSGQASLRRSRRSGSGRSGSRRKKIRLKHMSPFVRRGDIIIDHKTTILSD